MFAQADRKASTAARDFIASTYTPVGNSAYVSPARELQPGAIGYGFTNITLPLMQGFVSESDLRIARRKRSFRLRVVAEECKRHSGCRPSSSSLADRLAASIQGSYTDAAGACGADLTWCDGTVDGAVFTDAGRRSTTRSPQC